MTIGDLIRDYRDKEQISIREFARRSNISHTYICQMENNKTGSGEKPNLTVEMISHLSAVLGKDPQLIAKLIREGQEASSVSEVKTKSGPLTDEEVEAEIERLKDSEYVKLAKKEERVRYRRRQLLYQLRMYEKKGRDLAASGITMEILDRAEEE